ncbi:hypothetical protein DZF91_20925 [Actinomadura logoneensis]|uniref:DUF3558 domain-containing protein n=1 Tax=Actinomadura logoneensis TaxID=2293572 RepID=A0A372JIN8_9ACTN|nr:hypothetical protein DZF91_20925 [Actinomadura logoneensis]
MLAASVLLGGLLGACSAETPQATTLDPPTPDTRLTLRPGEYRSAPDPRTLLSPALREDLMHNADPHETKCRHKARLVADYWRCYVLTRYPGSRNLDRTIIHLSVSLPFTDTATAEAIEEFDESYKTIDASGPAPVPLKLGDQAYQSVPDREELRDAWIVFRRRNVVVSVSVHEARRDADGPESAIYADQLRRTRRLATELAQAVPQLPQ